MTKPEEQFHITVKNFIAEASSHWGLLAQYVVGQSKLPPEMIADWLKGTNFPETGERMRIMNFTINHKIFCHCD